MVDDRIRGKSGDLVEPYPLIGHLLDTAMIAGAMWDAVLTEPQRAAIGAALGAEVDAARQTVMFWAGLHDLGKIIPQFQQMLLRDRPDHRGFLTEAAYAHGGHNAGKEARLRHEVATNLVLPQLLDGAGYPVAGPLGQLLVSQVAQILGGHHGRYPQGIEEKALKDPLLDCPELGGGAWHTQRREHMRALHEALGCPDAPPGRSGPFGPGRGMPLALAVVVAGLVIVSDWLASQEHVVIGQQQALSARSGGLGIPAVRHAHAARAGAIAPGLVSGAGLGRAVFRDRSFSGLFPEIRKPFPLQASLQEGLPAAVAAGHGPGVLLVTAPPGEGKTEAALYAATVLGERFGSNGLFFALPTQATANQMYERVRRFAQRNLVDSAQLTLLHGAADLYEGYAGESDGAGAVEPRVLSHRQETDASGISVTASRWLRTRGRGLLAPIAVGTVDQALLGVLPVKRNALRHLGLSGKTVIIDEAHSFDAFTHALLLRLLTWLGAMRVPVVLLSATLTGHTAAGLVEAYLEGLGRRRAAGSVLPATPTPTATAYPGWLYADKGQVSGPDRPVGSVRSRSLDMAVRRVRHTYDAGVPDGRLAALLEELRPVTEEGGCAAVICTTVAEAQKTYEALREHFASLLGSDWRGWDDRAPGAGEGDGAEDLDRLRLRLLHARFPGRRRAGITTEAERWFGRTDSAGVERPRAAVLVSTQVIEQSLDFDFDLIVSDLAPMALLLQRAGRVWRHADPAPPRPGWSTGPRLAVLAPADGDGNLRPPTAWGDVYSPSLLQRTLELLERHHDGTPVEIPEGVQRLVDGVYDEEFDSADPDALMTRDLERLGAEMAAEGVASMVMLPKPTAAGGLFPLTTSQADEDLIATRLGAETVQLLPVYERGDGVRYLDEECSIPMPDGGGRGDRRFTRAEVRELLGYVVPCAYGPWMASRTQANQVPASWETEPRLARLVLLPHRIGPGPDAGAEGQRLGDRSLSVSYDLGLVMDRN
ncbi:CRISPR-associated endonuclease Cas3'' [Streptomyces sp. NPDC003691]